MNFIEQEIKGVWIIEPRRFGDARGYFMESYKQEEFCKHVGEVNFVQDNESVSSRGVLRGLHFQNVCNSPPARRRFRYRYDKVGELDKLD